MMKLIKQSINLICKGIATAYSWLESRPLYSFQNFLKKGGGEVQIFSIKREGLVKWGLFLKKGVLYHLFPL